MVENNPNTNNHHHQIKIYSDNKQQQQQQQQHYLCHFLLRLTKVALTLSFLLSLSLVAFSSYSSTSPPLFSTSTSTSTSLSLSHPNFSNTNPTRPDHILFSLSSSSTTWPSRQPYSHLWSNLTRTFVFLDRPLLTGLSPSLRVSSLHPNKASDRIARIIKDSFEMGLEEVRWFVMGDDDTVFFPENLALVLGKYDYRKMYYVGGNSESVEQDVMHGYETGFGGGGFAISYGLASELVNVLDACIQRYHHYYGSDEKVSACVGDLGVGLTRELGFHQVRPPYTSIHSLKLMWASFSCKWTCFIQY